MIKSKEQRLLALEKIKQESSATLIQARVRGALSRKDTSQNELNRNESALPLSTEILSNEDDNNEEQGAIDIEESNLEQSVEAEMLEQVFIREAPSIWPEPLHENFDNWPEMTDFQYVEDWIASRQKLLVRAITWNLCASPPPLVETTIVKLFPRNKFHLVVVGSEECERTIARSAVNTSKRNWETYLQTALGPNYVPVRAHTLQAIHIICFAHKAVAHFVSCVTSAAVATGVGNRLGNKGGVGITLKVGETSLLFVNAHLAAHQNAVKQRNADFAVIDSNLPSLLSKQLSSNNNSAGNRISVSNLLVIDSSADDKRPRSVSENCAIKSTGDDKINNSFSYTSNSNGNNNDNTVDDKRSSANIHFLNAAEAFDKSSEHIEKADSKIDFTGLANSADRVIFMGDLNYRIRGNRAVIVSLLEKGMHEVMLSNDQLIWSMKRGRVLKGFQEAPLNFRPTYKFDANSDIYDSSQKKRSPAWTDRILYYPNGLQCLSYDADFSLKSSDHRPVFATFSVDVKVPVHPPHIEKTMPLFSAESQVCSIM